MLASSVVFKKIHQVSKEALWILIGQATAFFGAIVGVRIMTGLLDPAAYGELSLGLTLATLVNQTLLGPLSNGVSRFYSDAHRKTALPEYFQAIKELLVAASFLVGIFFFMLAMGLFFYQRSTLIPILLGSLLYSVTVGINAIFGGIQNAARHRGLVALFQGIDPWIRMIIVAALLIMLTKSAEVAMYGYVLASLLLMTVQFFTLNIKTLKPIYGNSVEWGAKIWKYSWPFCAWGIFTWLQLASDRWALQYAGSDGEVGLYTVLYQLGFYPISVITGMVVQLLSPILFDRVSEKNFDQGIKAVNRIIIRLVLAALAMTLACASLVFIWHKELFELLVSEEYYSVSYLFPWMILSGGIFGAGQIVALNLMALKKTVTMLTPKVVTALLGLMLNLLGATYFGIVGVVAAGLIFSLLYFLWMTWLLARIPNGHN